MKTCYFHVGFHKTATTSLQQICGGNRDLLREAGIVYPQFAYPEEKGNRWNHSGPISQIYKRGKVKESKIEASSNERTKNRSFNQKSFLKALRQDSNLLLSGEALSCWPKEQYLRFLDDLDTFGYSVKALALVRSPYSFACSAIQETLKSGRYHPLVGLNRPHKTKGTGIQRIPNRSEEIKILQDVFDSSINFQPFSKAISHPQGPVAFCFEELGLPLSWPSLRQESSFDSNQSLNNRQARTINLFNKQLKLNSNRNEYRKSTRRLMRQGLENLKGGRFLLTQEEFKLIENHYNQLKKDMNTMLGPSFSEESVQFSDPITDTEDIIEALARCTALLATQSSKKSRSKTASCD